MKTCAFLRVSIVAAALGTALSAQAVSIHLTSSGTGVSTATTFDQTEKVLAQVLGYGPLTDLFLSTIDGTPLPLLGTGTYSGPGGTLNFSYQFNAFDGVGNAQSVSGTWTATGGTGTYLNATGAGTLAVTVLLSTSPFTTGTVFAGDVQAVPEPASMAALAVGAVALMRRRKRA